MKQTRILAALLISSFCIHVAAQHNNIDQKIDSILRLMTLDEKIGQLNLYAGRMNPTGPITMRENDEDAIRRGEVGMVFNIVGAKRTREIQRIAVEESRLKIPLLIGFDVIHGYRTIFPIPLGESASWDLDLMKRTAKASADEASAMGIHWTFAPMVDVCHDARWGRIMEGGGEDPYLVSLIAKAKVEGYQGTDLKEMGSVMACAKHFAAYGATIDGRDYNTADISDATLRNIYLPPFKAAVESGVSTLMAGYHELNGIPTSASSYLMTDILRNEWKFDGFVVSDWGSVRETATHGYAKDRKDATIKSFNAGLDVDMESSAYLKHMKELVSEGKISVEKIENSVRKVLKMKYLTGVMDNPYRYCNQQREDTIILKKEYLKLTREAACKSMVLLKNKNQVLPLSENLKSIAVIGPLADSKKDMPGSWSKSCDPKDMVTFLDALNTRFGGTTKIKYEKGCDVLGDDRSGFKAAIRAASKSDVILVAMGESKELSGEASSRSDISLPYIQKELLKELKKLNKPIVLILFNGRPLSIPWEAENMDAILEAWFPGNEAGNALVDVLFGKFNPQGKLTVSFPRSVGQVPIFYNHKNTGRPAETTPEKIFTTRYIDISNQPLYPFGFGLSYTTFEYSEIKLGATQLTYNGILNATVKVKNTGKYKGVETVQLYIRDFVASSSRPVKELKHFQKVELAPGEEKEVKFDIKEEDLRFWNNDKQYISEPGKFQLFIGSDSESVKKTEFELL
ncbi:MAG: glycoside hydrolase family 3 N-terminal domain-containing protein [Bacteroidales bacterium]|nr:glycoside hydrolase family 3 N-terminal domain-containing protein [Bacteroidales bacterium]